MKKSINLILLIATLLIFACSSPEDNIEKKFKNVDDITDNMLCESCGQPLIKKISTIHIVQMNNGDVHKYCSLNCLAKDWNNLADDTKNVLVMDAKFKTFFPAKDAHYVIRNTFGKSEKQTTAYAFQNPEYAQRFMKDFWGSEIVYFNNAVQIVVKKRR